MAEIRLTAAQTAAVTHTGGALLISAGAGSGKTKVLVERLLHRVSAEGLNLDGFLIITYTRAAAAELRGRILNALYERLQEQPGNTHLRRQTALLLQAKIGTIHSFCASVLRENAHLCGIRPDFRQLESGEEVILRSEVLREVLQSRYENLTDDFSALADTLGTGRDDSGLEAVVLRTYEQVQSHPDPEAWLQVRIDEALPEGDAGATAWGALLLGKARAAAEFWKAQMLEVLERLTAEPKLAAGVSPSFRDTVSSLDGFLYALDGGWDAANAFGSIAFPTPRTPRGMGSDPLWTELKALRDTCKTQMGKICAVFDGSSAELMDEVRQLRPVTDALFRLVRDFSQAYSAEKLRRGVLDFGDLEHFTLRLLTEADGVTPSELAKTLSRRYSEILVDEYQDCNRVQDAIFFAVSQNGQNVTMVGDVKQSIYRFRLADPTIFLKKYAEYRDEPAPGEGRRILLSENFRSDANILGAVNGFFRAVMSPQLGDLRYGDAEALKPGRETEGDPEAFRLYVSEHGDAKRTEYEAETVADYIEGLLRSGMTVPDGEGQRRLQPNDIAILLRATRGKDGVYAKALQQRGIPAVCLKSADPLQARMEVQWALSLLQVIDNPRQDIPLLAALRSPVWHFTEDELALVRCCSREGCFYDALVCAAETQTRCAEVLEALGRWRERSRALHTDALLSELYAETRLFALAEAREPGSGANLDQLMEYARSYGESGDGSLFAFLNRLREADAAGSGQMTAVFGGGDGVTITTIHGSKGLEYPVVVLADLMKRFNRSDLNEPLLIHPELGAGPKWTDRVRGIDYPTLPRLACAAKLKSESLSEELRVLYVAMTRARQRLAVFLTVADLAAARTKYRLPGSELPPTLLEDALSMGDWLLSASLHFGENGDWAWREVSAPAASETQPPEGEAETPEPEPEALPVSELRDALAWNYSAAAETQLPSKVTATTLRFSQLAGETAEEAAELQRREWSERDFAPPTFLAPETLSSAERGTAMHLAMQYADWSLCATEAGACEALRLLREKRMMTPAQLNCVRPEKLTAFVNSPVGQLFRSGTQHREFKFSMLAPVAELMGSGSGETLLQGVVDCWTETENGILLLDYKTDRVSREHQRERALSYAPQLRAYAWALTRITGKPVVRTFVWFFSTEDAVEL